MRILAVCAGNICRSPTVEAAIARAAEAAGLDAEVDSAGTGSWNIGQPPTPEAIDAGAEVGLTVAGRARRIHSADFANFDIIVAMDRSNYRDLTELAPSKEAKAKIRLFRTYDPDSTDDEISDPWGGTAEDYQRMVEAVMASAAGLVDTLNSA
ncbi:MAG: low molecular weight protein-tyrosine-phosphatase [Acidimicrobiia bacterium]